MYLEKLEIQGFKSFAQSTQLVFNRELTCVVGPNGSGKSNIADSIRWVLGEQSTKSLRGKRAEDVIFAGSDKKSRLGFAQVDLYLNNQDKQADIDFDKIVVTRQVERSGESTYLINGNKVRLFDVQMLLAKANFGQKTYSVIGQGMIDSILTSSSGERKEFFDEATGVRQFQIKKEQSILKLENAKENLAQSSQILAELEPRLRSLTRQVKRLDKRTELESALFKLQTDYYSFLTNNLETDIQKQRGLFDSKQKTVAELNQQLIELQTALDIEAKSSSRQENFELLQNKLHQYQNELAALLKEQAILEGQSDLKLMESGETEAVYIKNRLAVLQNEISKNKLSLQEKQQKKSGILEQAKALEAKKEAVLKEFAALEEALTNNSQDLSLEKIIKKQQAFLKRLGELTDLSGLSKLQDICREITRELEALDNNLKEPQKNQESWQANFSKLLRQKDELVSEISEVRTKAALLESEIRQLESNIQKDGDEVKKLSVKKQASSLNADHKEVSQKIDAKNQEIKVISDQIKDFNTQEQAKKSQLFESQKKFSQLQADFNAKSSELNEIKITLARLETKNEDLAKEIAEEFPKLEVVNVKNVDLEATRREILEIKKHLSIIGGIDESAVQEYQEVKERHDFLDAQTKDLHQAIDHLEKIIKDLDESISKQFDSAFKNINKLFEKYFKKLFSGGRAELILDIKEIKEENLGAEEAEGLEITPGQSKKQYGIEIKAVPPGKRLTSINMLSGGEKALTSIALICAIIANNPSPFVVLDEVDAALDEANSIRLVEILDELSDRTQFIAITHNRATMHKAKIIYGVTMGEDGVSKLLSINFDKADEIAA